MSTARAIEGVTASLRSILSRAVQDAGFGDVVTTRAPDRVRTDTNSRPPAVNLFLYHSAMDPHWRNVDPSKEGGPFPLALELSYLVTAFGENDDEISAHRLLGAALLALHDQPVMARRRLELSVREAELHEQLERIRITPTPLSIDEMYKLWASFQTAYRPSAAFQVRIVLIESERPGRSPLPVLRRGAENRGVFVHPDLLPPYALLEGVTYPQHQVAGLPGDLLTLEGARLDGDAVELRVRQPRRGFSRAFSPEMGGSATRLGLRLPAASAGGDGPVPPGHYELEALVTKGERSQVTGSIALVLAPDLPEPDAIGPPPVVFVPGGNGSDAIEAKVAPAVPHGRHVDLVVGDQVLRFAWPANGQGPRETFSFPLASPLPAGDLWVRVRVDGVESLLVDRSDPQSPRFRAHHRVTVPEPGGGP